MNPVDWIELQVLEDTGCPEVAELAGKVAMECIREGARMVAEALGIDDRAAFTRDVLDAYGITTA